MNNICAIVVTRGGYDISEVLDSLIFENVVVWDNSVLPDLKCWGRYAAINLTDCEAIYVQDDDCIVSREAQEALVRAYTPALVVSNMDPHWGHGHPLWLLPSGGMIFHRAAPGWAFSKWTAVYGAETLLGPTSTCSPDMVFAVLSPGKRLDFGKRDLARSGSEAVLHRQPGFDESRNEIYAKAKALRGEDRWTRELEEHVAFLRAATQ